MNVEKVEIRPVEAIEFSLTFVDGCTLAGKLPGNIAYRVINAALESSTIIRFDEPITEEKAREIRDRFTRTRRSL